MSEVNLSHYHPKPVAPGPCDPRIGCPPPTEIVCVKVNKVFEECRRTLTEVVDTHVTVTGPVTDVTCVSAQVVVGPTCTLLTGGRIRTTFSFNVTFRYTDNTGTHTVTSANVTVDITVRLSRAGEPALVPECDVFLECLECFLLSECDSRATIRCCVGVLVLFKLISLVQLMIPAYGYCPEPPECEQVAGECPVFVPVWPPYPPQPLFVG